MDEYRPDLLAKDLAVIRNKLAHGLHDIEA
jgi:hypothetical protein